MLKPFSEMWLQRDIKSRASILAGRQPFNLTEYVNARGDRGIEQRSDSSTEGERKRRRPFEF